MPRAPPFHGSRGWSNAPWHMVGRGSSSRAGIPVGDYHPRAPHSRAGRLPRPFPLDIPELTHRAHDCETCQEILLGIRSVCLMGVRIFLPLSRPAGCRAHGAGQGTHHGPQTQQDLRDKPACPGCILRVSTPSSDPPSQGGFSTRKENTKSTQNPPALTPYLLCFSQHGDFFHLETGS